MEWLASNQGVRFRAAVPCLHEKDGSCKTTAHAGLAKSLCKLVEKGL
jgi:hypothetical protein